MTWYWYACAALSLWAHSLDHAESRLAFAVIFVVLGTGSRILKAIEKGKP